MIPKELIPMLMFISTLVAVLALTQTIKLCFNPNVNKKTKKHPTYHWSDTFGILRGYLGMVVIWILYLGGFLV